MCLQILTEKLRMPADVDWKSDYSGDDASEDGGEYLHIIASSLLDLGDIEGAKSSC
jgi:hypothetical protein